MVFGFITSMSAMDTSRSLITSSKAIDPQGIHWKDSEKRDLRTLSLLGKSYHKNAPAQHEGNRFLKKNMKAQNLSKVLKNMFMQAGITTITKEQNGHFKLKISKSEIKDLSKLKPKLPKSGTKYVKQIFLMIFCFFNA